MEGVLETIVFPESYKWFIRNYGSGGICGVEILGIENKKGSFINSNKNLRNLTKKIEKIKMTPEQKGSLAKIFAQGDAEIADLVKYIIE